MKNMIFSRIFYSLFCLLMFQSLLASMDIFTQIDPEKAKETSKCHLYPNR